MLKKPKIIFIGTNEFAVKILQNILIYYKILAVITIPDFLKKNKIFESPVKKFSLIKKLNVIQPKNLKDDVFIKNIKFLKPDIQIVVSFKILPKEVWSIPPFGTINLHPSFLPEYRGAAPIHWVIINGEKFTGVTTFIINNYIDQGMILLQEKIKIIPFENFGSLSRRLSIIGGKLMIKTINLLIQKKIVPFLQEKKTNIKYARKITNEDFHLNWNDSIHNNFNKIRAFNPYPGAWTTLVMDNKHVIFKIYDAYFCEEKNTNPIGKVNITLSSMTISLLDGYISIICAQISGKNKLKLKDLVNGIKNFKKIFVI